MLSVIKQVGTEQSTATAEQPYVAPLPTPTAAPAYIAPTNPYINQDPMEAPAPDYQYRGTGGTPFAATQPRIYLDPIRILPPILDLDYGLTRDATNKGATPNQPQLPGRPGDRQTMPVPTGQQPAKSDIPKAVQPVPGPITGNVAGFDLAKVPFWGWLIAAAFLGSRLLK